MSLINMEDSKETLPWKHLFRYSAMGLLAVSSGYLAYISWTKYMHKERNSKRVRKRKKDFHESPSKPDIILSTAKNYHLEKPTIHQESLTLKEIKDDDSRRNEVSRFRCSEGTNNHHSLAPEEDTIRKKHQNVSQTQNVCRKGVKQNLIMSPKSILKSKTNIPPYSLTQTLKADTNRQLQCEKLKNRRSKEKHDDQVHGTLPLTAKTISDHKFIASKRNIDNSTRIQSPDSPFHIEKNKQATCFVNTESGPALEKTVNSFKNDLSRAEEQRKISAKHKYISKDNETDLFGQKCRSKKHLKHETEEVRSSDYDRTPNFEQESNIKMENERKENVFKTGEYDSSAFAGDIENIDVSFTGKVSHEDTPCKQHGSDGILKNKNQGSKGVYQIVNEKIKCCEMTVVSSADHEAKTPLFCECEDAIKTDSENSVEAITDKYKAKGCYDISMNECEYYHFKPANKQHIENKILTDNITESESIIKPDSKTQISTESSDCDSSEGETSFDSEVVSNKKTDIKIFERDRKPSCKETKEKTCGTKIQNNDTEVTINGHKCFNIENLDQKSNNELCENESLEDDQSEINIIGNQKNMIISAKEEDLDVPNVSDTSENKSTDEEQTCRDLIASEVTQDETELTSECETTDVDSESDCSDTSDEETDSEYTSDSETSDEETTYEVSERIKIKEHTLTTICESVDISDSENSEENSEDGSSEYESSVEEISENESADDDDDDETNVSHTLQSEKPKEDQDMTETFNQELEKQQSEISSLESKNGDSESEEDLTSSDESDIERLEDSEEKESKDNVGTVSDPGKDFVLLSEDGNEDSELNEAVGGDNQNEEEVLEDENDIVVLPNPEKKIKHKASKVLLKHPYTHHLEDFGCDIWTKIEQNDSKDEAQHYIQDIKPKGLAEHCRLRKDQDIRLINGIPTDGMTHEMIICQFAALKIDAENPLILVIRTVFPDEYEGEVEYWTEMVIKFTITATSLKLTQPPEVSEYIQADDKPIEVERIHGVSYVQKNCWIQHRLTDLYISSSPTREVVLEPLQRDYQSFIFERHAYRGLDKTQNTEMRNKPVVVFALKDTKDSLPLFVSSTSSSSVGLLRPYQSLSQTVTILNENDPRFFYHISRGVYEYFMSVQQPDCYLGCYEKETHLRLIKIENSHEYFKHKEIQFYVTYPSEHADIPSGSKKKTAV